MRRVVFAVVVALSLSMVALPTAAAKPKVLAPSEEPRGYSLAEAAAATAYFNAGARDSSTLGDLPQTFQGRPFQMLYIPGDGSAFSATFPVRTGTMLYVPVYFKTGVEGELPDLDDHEALADWFFTPPPTVLTISVDGVVTALGRDYVVGAETPGLPGGAGDLYTGVAAFVAPLAPGSHQVVISIDGFQISYTVNVR